MDLVDKNSSPKKFPERKTKRLSKGCTTLMYACQQGKSNDVVTELRIKPKSVHCRDKSNKSALHYCCGQLDLVAAASVTIAAPELLESADEDGLTPLHLAVIQGNLALVNLLLANKANVNAVDNEGHSVVHWATVCGEVEILRILLAANADISQTDHNGGSALHYAAQMSSGGFQIQSQHLALEILDLFLKQPSVQVDVCDKDGRQPLLWAASAGAVKAILMLVKAGARVESADKDGLTALHCAASRGHTECIDVLINLCGAPTDLIDSNGCTALHYAVTLGHADATYLLLDLNADPNRQDRKGRTPAHCGCAKGQFETVKMLRDRRANLWLRNAKGDLPLHEAAASGRRELVQWLLDQRPKHINTTSNDGRTILHIAAGNDYTDMCKMLLDYGADVNSIYRLPGNIVQTPLDCALNKGHRSTAKYLQLHGGLPANKLRLSGRHPNALNDTELVKPLHFNEQKRNELKKTRNVVLYIDRSDSDANATASTTEKEKSLEKKTSKRHSRHPCDCHPRHHHHHHHYRHRCRYRTSSCETIEVHHRDSGPDSATNNMCRSKSNVEICRYRRRRSKGRRDASPSPSTSSCTEESSSESYCRHDRYHKRRKEAHRAKASSKSADRSDEIISDKQMIKAKSDGETGKKSKQQDKGKTSDSRDTQSGSKQKLKKSSESTQQKSEKQVKTSNDKKQEEQEKSKIDDAPKAEIQSENLSTTTEKALGMNTEKETATEVPKPDTIQTPADQTIITTADVHATDEQVTEEPKVAEKIQEAGSVTKDQVDTKPDAAVQSSAELKEKDTAQLETSPMGSTDGGKEKKAETEVLKAQTATTEQALPEEKKGEETNATEDAQISQEQSATAATVDESSAKPLDEAVNVAADADAVKTSSEKDALATETVNAESTASATEPTEQQTEESSKSFQVLPTNQSSDNGNQESKSTGNLAPQSDTQAVRKTSFTVLKSDESIDDILADNEENVISHVSATSGLSPSTNRPRSFKVLNAPHPDADEILLQQSSDHEKSGNDDDFLIESSLINERSGKYSDSELMKYDEHFNGRKKKYKKRAKSVKSVTMMGDSSPLTKDQDSGFEPSPRAIRPSKFVPSTRVIYTATLPERPRAVDILDGRSCSSRLEKRKPGDKYSVNMTQVSQSLQRNIRRYYMEHKIFQHLLELKSLQIRSNKSNESLLVKRAVDDYHRSIMELGYETGGSLRRYPYKEYTFKNFEIFLYEVLKSLQKPGSNNFQNISDVYLEAERRLSPEYTRCNKALYCTSKTHRCLHAAHAYTVPMMNHHTIPKFGFGKTSMGSFYLPKICTKGGGIGGNGKCGSGNTAHNTVSLELSHGNNKQLITLPAEKLNNNKRYYVTFTLKENEREQQQKDKTTDAEQKN